MTSTTGRPRVICHMATSLDGRIVTDNWPASVATPVRREYDRVHESYAPDGWLCGRVTMEEFAGAVRPDVEVAAQHDGATQREDFLARGDHTSYAFAVDPSGRLAWKTNEIGGDHVVAILSQRVSDEYLSFLRERSVSYLLAGARDLDLALALEKIAARLGVRTLMLEGGGRINAGMLAAGLIDEVSVLLAPVADGRIGTAALFDLDVDVQAWRLGLESVEHCEDGVLWLRYRVDDEGNRT